MPYFIHFGVIAEALPDGLFLIQLDTDELILGYISAKMRRIFVEILPGDRVLVELCQFDSIKGRIIYRFREYPNNFPLDERY